MTNTGSDNMCKVINIKRPEPEELFKCGLCDKPILTGESYFKIGNLRICEKCNEGCKEVAK
jgi:hypothetical protein